MRSVRVQKAESRIEAEGRRSQTRFGF